jgi:putative transposase
MKKARYSEEQIIGILKEAEAGIPITELCRKYGISDATYYNWKAKYGGMTTSEMRKLRQLEDENRRLKQLVADLTLDNQALKAVISKNGSHPGYGGKRSGLCASALG